MEDKFCSITTPVEDRPDFITKYSGRYDLDNRGYFSGKYMNQGQLRWTCDFVQVYKLFGAHMDHIDKTFAPITDVSDLTDMYEGPRSNIILMCVRMLFCWFFPNFRSKWKKIALRNHPDKGGDPEKFRKLKFYKEFCEDWMISQTGKPSRFVTSKMCPFYPFVDARSRWDLEKMGVFCMSNAACTKLGYALSEMKKAQEALDNCKRVSKTSPISLELEAAHKELALDLSKERESLAQAKAEIQRQSARIVTIEAELKSEKERADHVRDQLREEHKKLDEIDARLALQRKLDIQDTRALIKLRKEHKRQSRELQLLQEGASKAAEEKEQLEREVKQMTQEVKQAEREEKKAKREVAGLKRARESEEKQSAKRQKRAADRKTDKLEDLVNAPDNVVVNRMAVDLRRQLKLTKDNEAPENPEWCTLEKLIRKEVVSKSGKVNSQKRAQLTKILSSLNCVKRGHELRHAMKISRSNRQSYFCLKEHFKVCLSVICNFSKKQYFADIQMDVFGVSSNVDIDIAAFKKAVTRVAKKCQ